MRQQGEAVGGGAPEWGKGVREGCLINKIREESRLFIFPAIPGWRTPTNTHLGTVRLSMSRKSGARGSMYPMLAMVLRSVR